MVSLLVLAVILASFGLIAFIGAPYVPTHRSQIRKAFMELKPLTKDDLVVDLGSGDGIILRMAAARGAKAVGYELNPILFVVSILLGLRYNGLIHTRLVSYNRVKLPRDATLIYAFTDGRSIKSIRRLLERHVERTKKKVHFMSYGFELPGYTPMAKMNGMFLYEL